MENPAPARIVPTATPVELVCPECGELVEVKDPTALVRALHLRNDCSLRTLLGSPSEE